MISPLGFLFHLAQHKFNLSQKDPIRVFSNVESLFIIVFFFFDMSTQEGRERFELVTSTSLSVVLTD
jgi:hypothetical protein